MRWMNTGNFFVAGLKLHSCISRLASSALRRLRSSFFCRSHSFCSAMYRSGSSPTFRRPLPREARAIIVGWNVISRASSASFLIRARRTVVARFCASTVLSISASRPMRSCDLRLISGEKVQSATSRSRLATYLRSWTCCRRTCSACMRMRNGVSLTRCCSRMRFDPGATKVEFACFLLSDQNFSTSFFCLLPLVPCRVKNSLKLAFFTASALLASALVLVSALELCSPHSSYSGCGAAAGAGPESLSGGGGGGGADVRRLMTSSLRYSRALCMCAGTRFVTGSKVHSANISLTVAAFLRGFSLTPRSRSCTGSRGEAGPVLMGLPAGCPLFDIVVRGWKEHVLLYISSSCFFFCFSRSSRRS
mmetsp:Transcript_35073/g.110380  ORF Transcript_35073/g.110380 Transcript_35073/m.110380 type:complete len:363 (-) Transcript_35073:550-1638(-)